MIKQDLKDIVVSKPVKTRNWTIPYVIACFMLNFAWQIGLAASLRYGHLLLGLLSSAIGAVWSPILMITATKHAGAPFSPKWALIWVGTALAAMVPTFWWLTTT